MSVNDYFTNAHRPSVTIAEIFDKLSELQKEIAYEIIGQALELGDYDREALVMFNKKEGAVIKFLLDRAMKGDI